MACPFFYPLVKIENDAYVIPPRLPLGDFYTGECRARSETFRPSDDTVTTFCNNGYGGGHCVHFPNDSSVDAIRFHIPEPRSEPLPVQFVMEKECWPTAYGLLEYALADRRFITTHSSSILQRQAEAFVESFLRRRSV